MSCNVHSSEHWFVTVGHCHLLLEHIHIHLENKGKRRRRKKKHEMITCARKLCFWKISLTTLPPRLLIYHKYITVEQCVVFLYHDCTYTEACDWLFCFVLFFQWDIILNKKLSCVFIVEQCHWEFKSTDVINCSSAQPKLFSKTTLENLVAVW